MNTNELEKMLFAQIDDIKTDLRNVQKSIQGFVSETDVRIQVHMPGIFAIHSGLACYDTDHSGYWGSNVIDAHATLEDLHEIALDLIDQVCEDRAKSDY